MGLGKHAGENRGSNRGTSSRGTAGNGKSPSGKVGRFGKFGKSMVAGGVVAASVVVVLGVGLGFGFGFGPGATGFGDMPSVKSTALTYGAAAPKPSSGKAASDSGEFDGSSDKSGVKRAGDGSQDSPKTPTASERGEFAEGEVLVSFEKGTTKDQAREILGKHEGIDLDATERYGLLDEERLAEGDTLRVMLAEGADVKAVSADVSAEESVSCQPNFAYHLLETETAEDDAAATADAKSDAKSDAAADVEAEDQAEDQGETIGWAVTRTYAKESWADLADKGTTTVVVIDTGCLVDHEDLTDVILKDEAYDFYANTKLTQDPAGHGTHVTGIVGAVANNGKGVAGVSQNVKILPLGVFGDANNCYTSDMIRAYDYMFDLLKQRPDLNIRVVNMSIGGFPEDDEADDFVLEQVIQEAYYDKDIVTVCAAGNSGYTSEGSAYSYPASTPEAVSVTALSKNGFNVASFSNYNDRTDICAPGHAVNSTLHDEFDAYGEMSGTSMASPAVAGAFASVFAANPDLTAEEAVDIVLDTVITEGFIEPAGREGLCGKGILDVQSAVRKALDEDFDPATYRETERMVEQNLQTGKFVYEGTLGKPGSEVDWSIATEGNDVVTMTLTPHNGVSGAFEIDGSGLWLMPWKQTGRYDNGQVGLIKVHKIKFEGDITISGDMTEAFAELPYLSEIDMSSVTLSGVKSLSSMFEDCFPLKTAKLAGLVNSDVRKLDSMFSGCSFLTDLDVSNWDVSHVTTMDEMLFRCDNLTEVDFSSWNVSDDGIGGNGDGGNGDGGDDASVANFEGVFTQCGNLTKVGLPEIPECASGVELPGIYTYYESDDDPGQTAVGYAIDKNGYEYDDKWNGPDGVFSIMDVGTVRAAGTYERVPVANEQGEPVKVTIPANAKIYGVSGGAWYWTISADGGVNLSIEKLPGTDGKFVGSGLGWAAYSDLITHVEFGEGLSIDGDLSEFFNGYMNLVSVDWGGLDTSGVTSTSNMFAGCASLKAFDFSKINLGSVEDATSMFDGCEKLTSVNFAGATFPKQAVGKNDGADLSYMFSQCSGLEELDLSPINLTGCDLEDMLWHCLNLKSLKVNNTLGGVAELYLPDIPAACGNVWKNKAGKGTAIAVDEPLPAGKADTYVRTVKTAPSLEGNKKVPSSAQACGYWGTSGKVGWYITSEKSSTPNRLVLFAVSDSKATVSDSVKTESPFNFNEPIQWSDYKVESVKVRSGDTITVKDDALCNAFTDMGTLTSADLYGLKTAGATTFEGLFDGCSSLKSVSLKGISTKGATNMASMFAECSKLSSLAVSGWDTSNVDTMSYMFADCSSLTSLKLGNGKDAWDTSEVTDMSNMFAGCFGLTSLDLSGFNTGAVEDFGGMFQMCTKLKSIKFGKKFTGESAASMAGMFSECTSLEKVDLSNFGKTEELKTEELETTRNMFNDCVKLREVKFGRYFDTSNVEDMAYMFNRCEYLKELDLSSFDTTSLADGDDVNCGPVDKMLGHCERLESVKFGASFGWPVELPDKYRSPRDRDANSCGEWKNNNGAGEVVTDTVPSVADSYTREPVACDHVEEKIPAKAATCTEDGWKGNGIRCSKCDDILVESIVVKALGHDLVYVEKRPTLDEGGYSEKRCQRPGCDYAEEHQDLDPYKSVEDEYDYVSEEGGDMATLKVFKGGETKVEVPDQVTYEGEKIPVTKIGDKLFKDNDVVTSIVVPEGVTYIGSEAFANCPNLTKVTLPASLTDIKDDAFANTNTKNVKIYVHDGSFAKKWAANKGLNWVVDVSELSISLSYTATGYATKLSNGETLKCPATTYSGKKKTPTVTVRNAAGTKLAKGTSYTLSYSSSARKYVGVYTVTVKGKGHYAGSAPVKFIIKPRSTYISSLSAATGGFKVKWKKRTTQTSGYELRYGKDKGFAAGTYETFATKSNRTLSKKVTGLESGTSYYAKVRTYKKTSSYKVYGTWSKVKSVKTK